MKKGLKALLTVLIVAIVCSFAVTCADKAHTHTASGEWQTNESQHWKVCADDGEKVDVNDHTFGEWVTDKAATCTDKGSKHRECSVCGYKATEELPATGHDYEYTDNGDGTHKGVCKNDSSHVIASQKHTLGKDYDGHNEEKHWKVCTACNAKVESEHEFRLDGDTYACACGESMTVTAKDLYKVNGENESERKTFEIDLKVKAVNVLVENQEVGAENYTINLGSEYNGELLYAKIGRLDVEGATLVNGVLTLPQDTYTANDTGDQTIECVVACDDGVYKLTVHVTVATRVISTVEEWSTILRDPVSLNARNKDNDDGKSGVYGYFTVSGDIDFEHKALRDPAFPEGADTTSLIKKSTNVDGKLGFVGTFDGRGYALKNFNTENPFGLFLAVSDENATKSTIKNLVVDGVWHDNGVIRANIFGHSMANVTFDNITINVEKTSLTGNLVKPTDGTSDGRGFICGAYANRNVYKNLTVNASGCTISSLFGWWIKRPYAADSTAEKPTYVSDDRILTCENVIVNAREITYWGRIDGETLNGVKEPTLTPEDYPISGLTYNKDEINEVEITDNGKRFVVDLKVADTTKALSEQVVGATGNITLNLGNDYGTLNFVKFNGEKIVGATVDNNVLTIPVSAFGAGATGEREVEVEMAENGAINALSVKILVVTNQVKTVDDINAYLRTDGTNKTKYGYIVLGNDIDFKNVALTEGNDKYQDGFQGTFDGLGYHLKNYVTCKDGLLVTAKNSTIKNIVFDDLVHDGGQLKNVFGACLHGCSVENVVINVKSSVIAEGSDMTLGTLKGYGFLIGRQHRNTSFTDLTVNAEGQEIYSFFAYWLKVDGSAGDAINLPVCNNVVIKAKKVQYWGRSDGNGNNSIESSAKINGVTLTVA